jgi:hypothetical protein
MQPPKPANPYHGVLSGREMFRGKDGKSAFKVYFIDIIGRKDPSRTVWAQCGVTKESFNERLAAVDGLEGVGFITAFPHIAKAFRFGPEAETVLNVRAWNSKDMTPLNLGRSQEYVEFACLAEAAIAAEEYLLWAHAKTVEEYLRDWAISTDWPVKQSDKLAEYWNA